MGYACPVCDAPQADGEHLANHLAFTALLHGDDHEAWLEDRIPDWETLSAEELADRAVEFAPEADYPTVFEDTTDARDHDHDHVGDAPTVGEIGDGSTDEEVDQIIARAREWTRRSHDIDETACESDADEE